MSALIQIVPEIPPNVGGVGDYADRLKDALAPRGYETRFLVPIRPSSRLRADVTEFHPADFAPTLEKALISTGATNVLLHYVGYGFHPRGCPEWLVDGLEQSQSRLRLTTIFHEIHTTGPPWTVRFWLVPKQKDLLRRLSRTSAERLVSSVANFEGMKSVDLGSACRVVATPSNFGEPPRECLPPTRPPQAAILGLHPIRWRVYAALPAIEAFCRRAGMEKIHDIGPSILETPATLAGVPVQAHGILPTDAVSRLLLQCRVLITSYAAGFAAKSGVIAAGMAHGCAVYNCTEPSKPSDKYNQWRPADWDGADWQQAGEEAYAAYHRSRSWDIVTEEVLACLR